MNKIHNTINQLSQYCLPVKVKIFIIIFGVISSICLILINIFGKNDKVNQELNNYTNVSTFDLSMYLLVFLVFSLITLKIVMMLCQASYIKTAWLFALFPIVIGIIILFLTILFYLYDMLYTYRKEGSIRKF